MKKAPEPSRPARLGPWGEGVEIAYGVHALERLEERVLPFLPREEFDQLVRFPNTKQKDVVDPDFEDRARRWVLIGIGAEAVRVRVVFLTTRSPTKVDRGALEVVTLVLEARP